jgi:GNAT superfamily N-acetyltransferase
MSTLPAAIRKATAQDLHLMVDFLRRLLADMAVVGGHPVSTAPDPWTQMAAEFRDHLQEPGCLHLLAETTDTPPKAVGWAFARSTERDAVYAPARVLHVHAVYVAPSHRRQGIGRALLAQILDWGRSISCTEAELNVLVDNPARALYRELGFSALEIEMTRKL